MIVLISMSMQVCVFYRILFAIILLYNYYVCTCGSGTFSCLLHFLQVHVHAFNVHVHKYYVVS